MRIETNSRKLIRLLEKDGWYWVGAVGSHHHFKHPERPGKLQVPHPKKDLPLVRPDKYSSRPGFSVKRNSHALCRTHP
jgi:predicted RNA binding protein YcfA (HicA-like mRNA interferase family)